MQIVCITRLAPQLALDLVHRVRVEQVAELLLAQELAQEVAVERQRLRPPLRRRRVVLEHVRRHVVEEQRGREGRSRRRLDVDDVHLAGGNRRQQLPQRLEVEDVLQALAIRLQHDRERREAPRDLEQRLRLQPLLPERCPLTGAAPRDEQRARRVLAEARAEERALPHRRQHELLDARGVEQQLVDRGHCVRIRQVERDAVVRPDRLRVEAERLVQPRGERERPGRVHAAAERRQHADPPVADLVAEALDDDRPVGRHGARRRLLLAEEREEVPRGERVEVVVGAQPPERLLVGQRHELARRLADRLRPARTAARRPRPSRTARPRARPARERRARGRA